MPRIFPRRNIRPFRAFRNATAFTAILLLLSLSLSACGGGDKGTGGDGGGSGPISARIDGKAWVSGEAYSTCQVSGAPGSLVISGSQVSDKSAASLVMSLYNLSGPGTFPLGVGPSVYGGIVALTVSDGSGGAKTWMTPMTGMDGSITFTKLGADGVAGTFRCTLRPGTDTTGEAVEITEGHFDLPLKGTLSALPAHAGHRVSATLNGVPFQAVGVTVNPSQLQGTGLQFVATTLTRSISLVLTDVSEPGTYRLQNAAPVRILAVVSSPSPGSAISWGPSGLEQDAGTVVVTHLSATRAKGTFTATLSPQAGSADAGPMVLTDGEFDIGIE